MGTILYFLEKCSCLSFSGENYQGQENSSSYEYLPGHLVSDNRPPTVLNTRPESLPIPPLAMALPDNVDSVDALPPSLDVLSSELREKSKDLMAKNISQTKHFFKKLKDYIEYLSTPSLTIEDSKVKQELADRIMSLLSNEESRLGRDGNGIFDWMLHLLGNTIIFLVYVSYTLPFILKATP